MDQLSLASTPTVQRTTTTTTSKVRRSHTSAFVASAEPTTAPTRDAPAASAPAWVTVANFMAHHHSHGECLAHPSGQGCDCEMVQLPTLGQDAAWKVMAQRFKAVHDKDTCWNQRRALPAPPSTSANEPPQRRQRPVPTAPGALRTPRPPRPSPTNRPPAPTPHSIPRRATLSPAASSCPSRRRRRTSGASAGTRASRSLGKRRESLRGALGLPRSRRRPISRRSSTRASPRRSRCKPWGTTAARAPSATMSG